MKKGNTSVNPGTLNIAKVDFIIIWSKLMLIDVKLFILQKKMY